MFAEVFLFSNYKASGCARKGMAFFYTQKQVADLKKSAPFCQTFHNTQYLPHPDAWNIPMFLPTETTQYSSHIHRSAFFHPTGNPYLPDGAKGVHFFFPCIRPLITISVFLTSRIFYLIYCSSSNFCLSWTLISAPSCTSISFSSVSAITV